MTWRARSASDRREDWPLWYVTDDSPADANKTAKAWKIATGEDWPPRHQFLPREGAEDLAKRANEAAQ